MVRFAFRPLLSLAPYPTPTNKKHGRQLSRESPWPEQRRNFIILKQQQRIPSCEDQSALDQAAKQRNERHLLVLMFQVC